MPSGVFTVLQPKNRYRRMQAMVGEQLRLRSARHFLSKGEELDLTASAICTRLGKRQFEEGNDLFAVQWAGIHRVARTGDIRGLRYFLDDMRKSVEVRDDRGDTPLNTAAYAGQLAAARELLERGADVDTKNNKGWTPAISASSGDHREMIMLLQRSGANLRLQDMTGSTVAHMAASCNSVGSLRAIHDCFGDPTVLSTAANNGITPAHVAAVFDNVEALKALFDLGATIDAQDNSASDHGASIT